MKLLLAWSLRFYREPKPTYTIDWREVDEMVAEMAPSIRDSLYARDPIYYRLRKRSR